MHQTMRRLVRRLEKANIPHAVVGGMAVFIQGYRRTTDDLDILVTREGLAEFRKKFVPKHYTPDPKLPRRFTDKSNDVTVDFLVTGLFPGRGQPGPIAYPDPVTVREQIRATYVVNLATLIQLKLAARRHQDFADVVNLIGAHNLDESFQQHLHPTLHRDYIECLEENRREEEYLTRED